MDARSSPGLSLIILKTEECTTALLWYRCYTYPPQKKYTHIYIYIAVLMDVSDNLKKMIFGEQKIN